MPTLSGALSSDPLAEEKAAARADLQAQADAGARRITTGPAPNQAAAITPSLYNQLGGDYTVRSLDSELWREVEMVGGLKIRIDNPIQLITRNGGSTHRVIDAQGVVHCYPAPETGKSVIRWKSKPGYNSVNF